MYTCIRLYSLNEIKIKNIKRIVGYIVEISLTQSTTFIASYYSNKKTTKKELKEDNVIGYCSRHNLYVNKTDCKFCISCNSKLEYRTSDLYPEDLQISLGL